MIHPRLEKPHILFLFSDTGGGHRSAAQAIIEALNLEFPGQTTQEMVDVLREYAPPPLHKSPEIYPPLTRMPKVWGAGYYLSNGPRRVSSIYRMIWPYIRWGMYRLVVEHPCDLIVSVHQLVNQPMARILAAHNRPIPFTTVVTDMVTTHAAWYSNQADRIIVPTQDAYRRGVELGISKERMFVAGQPVAERFCAPVGSRQAVREQLGWPDERPVVLVVGGGEGMGPLEPAVRAIDAANLPVTMVIVAGRNKKLKERLEKTRWNIPVRVYGFVEQMPDFMRAADFLITKAGPGTISEGFIAGLPLILYSRLPGQEDGNVVYVVDHGAGVWAPRPDAVVAALKNWLEHPFLRKQAADASLKLARPKASRHIARLLAEQVGLCETEAPLF